MNFLATNEHLVSDFVGSTGKKIPEKLHALLTEYLTYLTQYLADVLVTDKLLQLQICRPDKAYVSRGENSFCGAGCECHLLVNLQKLF